MKRALWFLALAQCAAPAADPCPPSYCSNHGVCTIVNNLPSCECAEPYADLVCSTCAPGHHRLGADCVEDESCDDTTCSGHGTCSVAGGVTACECAAGYDGARCNSCYGKFKAVPVDAAQPEGAFSCEAPQQCNVGSCAPGFACDDATGTVVCECRTSDCVACTDTLCGDNGACDDSSGYARCVCNAGYQGASCASCYPGYHASGDTCVVDDRCTPRTCAGGGVCSIVGGAATCACATGYAGDYCETCDENYHLDANGACSADQSCTGGACPAHATCDDSSKAVVCRCDDGYAGANCDQCYPGYHTVVGGACVIDDVCTGTSCGGGACEDASGTVVCSLCGTGYSGDHCEVNIDDCGSACQTGQCIDLIGARQCLCTDGTWGQTCLPGPTVTTVSPSSADERGGISITLSGTGFVNGAAVLIDGTPCTGVVFNSATSLTATVPLGRSVGSKQLRVINPNAQVATSSFTYRPVIFTFTGGVQAFTGPTGVTSMTVAAWGAGGGGGEETSVVGGAGGFAKATFAVTPGQSFAVIVGQGGARISTMGMSAAGAGGGYSGLFFGAVDQSNVRLIAGGGGGAGLASDATLGAVGGNGGGSFGGEGSTAASTSYSARGLGGSGVAGGIGGCFLAAQCGDNGSALTGGGGGLESLAFARSGATFGGGGGAGAATSSYAGGGGGGYFGGGGGGNGAASAGGGGSGFLHASAANGTLTRSATPGLASDQSEQGFQSDVARGGHAAGGSSSGGNGLVVISW